MGGTIVLLGATGFTGRLTAEALVALGGRPILAGRSGEKLHRLVGDLGVDLNTVEADVGAPESLRGLLSAGDVLVTTVGPFTRLGDPAVEAAIAARASYLDSTGEPGFIRRVFERFGPRAKAAGCGLVTAFGYDFVPGNLAGALALRDAGEAAERVDVGYFVTGDFGTWSASRGTATTLAEVASEPVFVWRDGLRAERAGRRTRSFAIDGRRRRGLSVGGTEHIALPRLQPGLREVNVYLGWFGPFSGLLSQLSLVGSVLSRAPVVERGARSLIERFAGLMKDGPGPEARARQGSRAVAIAYDGANRVLSEVHLRGPNGYELTGRLLAWGAIRAAEQGMQGAGALGPVEAFGLDELEAGCAEAGLVKLGDEG